MPKYDYLSLVFTKTEDEFKKYIKLLEKKPYIFESKMVRKNTATIRTRREKTVLLVRVEGLMDVKKTLVNYPFKLGDKNTEVIMTGAWFEAGWIHPILENLRDNNPDLKFRVVSIGTKPR